MSSGDPIRVGLVGYGLAGAVFHGPLIASTPGMVVGSVVTSDPERQSRARQAHPDARIVPNIDELWAAASDHDLVVIGSPNRSHVPIALRALEEGLHVVIDKPMAPTAAEGQKVVEEAAARDLLLTVFQNRRWDGDFLTLRPLLQENALGEVIRFESRFERWRPAVRPDAWRERSEAEEAGGLLFDLGAHLIDQAVQLFGPPTRVYAEVDRSRPGAEVDDDTFVALEHASGVRSHLWMNVLAAIRDPRMRVLGLAGTYEKYGLDVQEEALANGMRPGDPDWGREPADAWGRLVTDDGERTVETEAGAYERFYGGVVEALRSSGPPPVDPLESVGVLRIIEAAFDSARSGSVVAFEPSTR
ncbi:MAG TPA: Gfo/Idh/MocA family oxidoreductase [Actinomycetota bacterium]|nr:Gfo/Idh/MocA family oxidoreductase [Actinomycetota bacterium]